MRLKSDPSSRLFLFTHDSPMNGGSIVLIKQINAISAMSLFDGKSRNSPAGPKKRLHRVNMNLNVSEEIIVLVDQLKVHYGVQTRPRVVEMILEDLLRED